MIFLPNKFERYTAALRNMIHISAIKQGKNKKHFEKLQKIYIAEACYFKDSMQPVNIGELSSRLLTSVYIKKLEKDERFEFSIKVGGNFLINPKLYTAVLLTVCKTADKVYIFTKNGMVVIKAEDCKIKPNVKIIKAAGGSVFFEKNSRTALITLSLCATDKKADGLSPEITDILNPFSPVNMFI